MITMNLSMRSSLLVLLLSIGASAHAENIKIGVVNRQRVFAEAKKFREDMDEFQREVKVREDRIIKQKAKIEEKYNSFMTGDEEKGELTPDQQKKLMEMSNKLQKEQAEAQSELQERSMELDKECKTALEHAVKELVAAEGWHFVLYEDILAYAQSSSDVTEKVIAILNKKHDAEKRAAKLKTDAKKN